MQEASRMQSSWVATGDVLFAHPPAKTYNYSKHNLERTEEIALNRTLMYIFNPLSDQQAC